MSSASSKKIQNTSTTGTGKNTALLGISNNAEKSNEISAKKLGKISLNKKIEEQQADLESKTKELQEKLNKILSDIELEKNLLIEETNQNNIELTEKEFEISSLSSEHKNILSQLKEIKSSLDGKMKIEAIFFKKKEGLNKEEAKLKKYIDVKNKEIELAQKNKAIYEKDFNQMKKIADKNDEKRETLLNEELENLEKSKEEALNLNKSLRQIIKKHKYCSKEKSKLMSKLNVLTNNYHFELKKTNMMKSELVTLEEKKGKIKKEVEQRINENKRDQSYGSEIRKKVLDKMKKKNSEKNLIHGRTSRRVEEICNTIEEHHKRTSADIKKSKNINYKLKPKVLFTENEQLQLATIIPPIYLNKFKEKFDSVESQRFDLVDKIKNNQNKQNNLLNSAKIKLNYSELKKKEQKLLYVDLNSHLAKKNLDISNLKSKINKITKEYNHLNKILKIKTNEQNRLNEYINERKKKNKGIEQSGEISKRSKNIDYERKNIINLAYEMEKLNK